MVVSLPQVMHAAAAVVEALEPQVVHSAAAVEVEPQVVHSAAADVAAEAAEEAAVVAAAITAEEPAEAARAGLGTLETTCARTEAAKSARETATADFIVCKRM